MRRLGLLLLSGLLVLVSSEPGNERQILAGQHIVYSYPSSSQPPAELLDLTRAGLVGGIILFGVNIDNQTAAAVQALKEAYGQSPAPALLKARTGHEARFLVTADQEGGKVRRIRNGEPQQSAKQIGASADVAATARAAGGGAAQTLQTLGINANLAPVVDVFRQADDLMDHFERSFGNTSEAVAAAAVPFIQAQQEAGVAATAKHFPGLGWAPRDANTDERAVTIDQPSLEELRSIDEEPYRQAMAAGVAMVMASWAIYPALDAQLPAGLSRCWMHDELRGRLGFEGVTISDAMEAGAVTALGDTATTGRMAAAAGLDILLASSRNVSQGSQLREGLVAALDDGSLDEAEFDEATRRIAAMRSRIAV
ncbi:hypothetical protein CDD82_6523 [Ophiocordyceps australis]|uniref:Glycoside hydrolase family 3 N-terminal domain-containing protein n=1 Tax=Ophiocordyceps australis TaxID=1399860 RepID=A0A2C5ZS66_9HYPO|nr:hypothetical protein CDD82_6523 [Ophiocordyceps australis]